VTQNQLVIGAAVLGILSGLSVSFALKALNSKNVVIPGLLTAIIVTVTLIFYLAS
jgi:hypothetical protein